MFKYISGILGDLPPWAYVAIIGGGIAAAVFLPKFFRGGSSGSSGSSASDTGASGASLAVDPATGLPYAMSGYPAGAFAGGLSGSSGASAGAPQATPADFAEFTRILQQISDRIGSPRGTPGAGTPGFPGTHPNPVPLPPTPAPTPAPIHRVAAHLPHVTAQPSHASLASRPHTKAVAKKIVTTSTLQQRARRY